MDTTPPKRKYDASLDDDDSVDNNSDQPERTGKKLKALKESGFNFGVAVAADGHTPHISAPVWGHVLDYMPYQEVRSALLVGKVIANDAVKHVHTLSFMESYQLDGPSCRRFANVEDVNILCLVEKGEISVLCAATSVRMAPVLTNFPKLKWVFAGGWNDALPNARYGFSTFSNYRILYSPPNSETNNSETNERRKQKDIFKDLMKSLLGPFQARMLSPSLALEGLDRGFWEDFCEELDENVGACAFCRNLISTLPLNFLVDRPGMTQCFDEEEYYRMLRKRSNVKKAMDGVSAKRLLDTLLAGRDPIIGYLYLETENESDGDESELAVRLQGMGVTDELHEGIKVQYVDDRGMDELDRVISLGFDPKAISKADLYGEFCIGQDDREYDVFAKCTFDALVSRGFAFDAKDLIVLDERSGPGLRRLPALIRRTGNDSE